MRTYAKISARILIYIYLGKACVHEQVQETAKEFIAHEYGKVQVPQCHRGGPFKGIWEMSGHGEDKPNHIQGDHKRKQFPGEWDQKQNQKHGQPPAQPT
jgi:hypothetical protein